MSRIGNKAVEIPAKVKVNIDNSGKVAVEGPKGKLDWTLPRGIKANVAGNEVSLARDAETRSVRALHGLSRALINNMVVGVSEGFTKNLEIEGVGFKAAVQGKNLNLSLGFSHPVLFPIPPDIKITVTENTKIAIEGIDKKIVGQVAADIRRLLPAGTLQGQRRSLRGRADSPQGRQNRPIVSHGYDQSKSHSRPHSQPHPAQGLRHGGTSAPLRSIFPANMFMRRSSTMTTGNTLVSAATTEKALGGKGRVAANRATAEKVGKPIAERGIGEEYRQGSLRSRRISLPRQSESAGRRGARRRT